jgi:two-component sensor histidine kinase/CheY-like chemotaxis protein
MNITVLIVDDEPHNIRILEGALFPLKYRILTASNGEQCLELASKELPDIIILDVMMPEMNGYEVCAKLKHDKRTSEIPVVIASALSNVNDEKKGFDVGATDYIKKPLSPPIVRARVKTHIALKTAREQLFNQNTILEEKVKERTTVISNKNKELEKSLQEKNILLKEVHHRVRNNLQMISSLLLLQLGDIDEPAVEEAFIEYQNRIESINLIHNELYNSKNYMDVDLVLFLRKLVKNISTSMSQNFDEQKLVFSTDTFIININIAIPCAMILNELFTILFESQFIGDNRVSVLLQGISPEYTIVLHVPEINTVIQPEGFSLELIKILLSQLNGKFEIKQENGLKMIVHFKSSDISTYHDIDELLNRQ